MHRWRFAVAGILFQLALILIVSACGSSSSSSKKTKPTPTQTSTPSPTPTASIQAQAPIDGTVAIIGQPGVAPGAGTVQGTVGASNSSHRKAGSVRCSACTASGLGDAYPDGSFTLSVCANVGDQISLKHTNSSGGQQSLGSITVPQETSLPSCPAGFRRFSSSTTAPRPSGLG
jgi:hypothetical protein